MAEGGGLFDRWARREQKRAMAENAAEIARRDQQRERLDRISKSMVLQSMLSAAGLCGGVFWTGNIVCAGNHHLLQHVS